MNSFRFCPELLDCRNAALEALSDAGFEQFSHFSGVDLRHDLYGIEVCGIREEKDARGILDVLARIFPEWAERKFYLKDQGIEPGWMSVVHRDRRKSTRERK
jgi:hypothetical protein